MMVKQLYYSTEDLARHRIGIHAFCPLLKIPLTYLAMTAPDMDLLGIKQEVFILIFKEMKQSHI
jgi:hypothetical protein